MSGASLADLIAQCIASKVGNKEFALSYDGSNWLAEIGNWSEFVCVAEIGGEFQAYRDTPEAAVAALIDSVRAG